MAVRDQIINLQKQLLNIQGQMIELQEQAGEADVHAAAHPATPNSDELFIAKNWKNISQQVQTALGSIAEKLSDLLHKIG